MSDTTIYRCDVGHVLDFDNADATFDVGVCGADLTDGPVFGCAQPLRRQCTRPGFDGLPDVRFLPDGRLETQTTITYYAADGRAFHIPAGVATDLASVPRGLPGVFRMLFRSELHTASAAILHDRLYYTGEVSRAEADALFYEALRATHESRVGAWAMWLGVRSGGWNAWRKHRSAA